jgi:predicted RND superfamily exporter protein
LKELISGLKKYLAKSIILLVLGLVIWSAFAIPKLKFSFDLERFFPNGDNDLSFYMDFREKFSPDNDFVLIGIKNNQGIFQESFLRELDELTDSLEGLEYVKTVMSPVNVGNTIIDPLGGVIIVPYIHVESPDRYLSDSIRLFKENKLLDVLISRNGSAVSVNLITEEKLSKRKSDDLLLAINKLIDQHDFDEIHLGGRIPSQAYVIDKMGGELILFMGISFVILLLVLYWLYRSFLGVVLPLVIVIFSTVILLGVLVLIDESINLVITILPVVMFVVGTSDVIHVLSRYSSEKLRLNNWSEALRLTFKEVGFATLLTSITTAVGFATLMTATIYPVQRFGIVMAIGVMIAFCVTFLLLPSLLYLIKDRWSIMKGNEGGEILRLQLPVSWFEFILQYRNKLLLIVVGIVILCFAGMSRLRVNNYLLDDLRANDPHMIDFKFFEDEFSGVRPFELALESPNGLMSYAVQKEVEKLEEYLQADFNASNIISPLFFTKSINQALNGGSATQFTLPVLDKAYKKQKKYLNRFKTEDFYKSYVADDGLKGRLSAKIMDEGKVVIDRKVTSLNNFVQTNINPELLSVKVTGTAMLIDKNAEYLAVNMLQGLGIAFVIISVIVAILFRSFRMVIISLIPNMLPLLMIAGFMGLVGIDLKASTIIIFTISFGIAVDDTIHFLSKLKLELAKGIEVDLALKNTYVSTGKAIVITSVILFSGFASLMFSTFQSTFYIGVLISLTLLFAMLSDLVVLPILVKKFYKQ